MTATDRISSSVARERFTPDLTPGLTPGVAPGAGRRRSLRRVVGLAMGLAAGAAGVCASAGCGRGQAPTPSRASAETQSQRHAAERAARAPSDAFEMPDTGLAALAGEDDPRIDPEPATDRLPGEAPGLTDAWIVGPETPSRLAMEDAAADSEETIEAQAQATAALLRGMLDADAPAPPWAGPVPPDRPVFSASAPRPSDPTPTYAAPPRRPASETDTPAWDAGRPQPPALAFEDRGPWEDSDWHEAGWEDSGREQSRASIEAVRTAEAEAAPRVDAPPVDNMIADAPPTDNVLADAPGLDPTRPGETPPHGVAGTPERVWASGLIDRLRAEARESAEPFAAMLRVAVLEAAADPASVIGAESGTERGSASGSDEDLLSPGEAAAWRAARAIVRGFLTGRASSGAPADALALLTSARETLAPSGRVRIAAAELCRRVAGYGLYEPFERSTFLAGGPKRVIVYTEADGFAHRPATESERASVGLSSIDGDPMWSVALGLELNLYHEADGVLAWRRPRETVVDISRRQRRDFYVVADIELPPTLTVGRYQLKVILRDETTGAEDEALLPIEVVADRSALALGG